jgi:hypothetical protein
MKRNLRKKSSKVTPETDPTVPATVPVKTK